MALARYLLLSVDIPSHLMVLSLAAYEASMISPVIVTVLAVGFVEHPRAVDDSTYICTAPRKCVVRPDASCFEPGSSIWLV